jgi:hypothetical protein
MIASGGSADTQPENPISRINRITFQKAQRMVAGRSTNAAECAELLAMLGLSGSADGSELRTRSLRY